MNEDMITEMSLRDIKSRIRSIWIWEEVQKIQN